MKIYLDTNVLISAFIIKGTCNDLVDHCIGAHEVLVSSYVLDEFKRVINKKFTFTPAKIEYTEKFISQKFTIVPEGTLKVTICRDRKDNPVLSSAYEAKADCIVSGDKDLLELKNFKKIPIIAPSGFLKWERKHSKD